MSAVEMIRYGDRWAVAQSEVAFVTRDPVDHRAMGMEPKVPEDEWSIAVHLKDGRRLEATGTAEFTEEFFTMIVEAMESV